MSSAGDSSARRGSPDPAAESTEGLPPSAETGDLRSSVSAGSETRAEPSARRGAPDPAERRPTSRRAAWLRWLLAACLVFAVLFFYLFDLHEYFSWDQVRGRLTDWQTWTSAHAALALPLFFLLYVAVTGLSLPVAAMLSLVAGALFGLGVGAVLVSVAATVGATLAFLSSRYVLRRWVESRFGDRLRKLDVGIQRDGAYYLFTLRLVPVFPFFLINLGMGVTPLRLWTFVWVSWLGMLPGTLLYVNAGSELGKLESPGDVLSPGILLALALLGVAPLLFRLGVRWLRRDPTASAKP